MGQKVTDSHTSDAVLRAMRPRTVPDHHAATGRFTSCGLASCVVQPGAASDLLDVPAC